MKIFLIILAVPVILYLLGWVAFLVALQVAAIRGAQDVVLAQSPFTLRIVDQPTGAPIPGMMLWVKYSSWRIFGPFYSDSDGVLRIPASPFVIRMTGTIMDQGKEPGFYLFHPTEGAVMFSSEKDTPSEQTFTWERIRDVAASYGLIRNLPRDKQPIAQEYLAKHAT